MNTYNVYQFYDDNGKIIYVGKTKRSMNDRMRQHFGKHGHLSKEILNKVKCIKYYEFLTERDMDLAEAYLIKKYKKLFNTKKECISKNDIKYIEKKIANQKLMNFGGTEVWQQSLKEQQEQKTTIPRQVFLKLRNILRNLILKT